MEFSLDRLAGTLRRSASALRSTRAARREQQRRSLGFEGLENRRLLVIGASAFATAVPRGGDFDGVVTLFGCTGSLLETARHILTAAHCVDNDGTSGTLGADGPMSLRFQMARGATNINLDFNVPTADITVKADWDGGVGGGEDLAIGTLTDGQSDRHLIAPFGAQRYALFAGDPIGRDFTQVGYGETGTGNTGQQSNEVQRVSINNPSGGTFTLTFQGQTTAAIAEGAASNVVATALQALPAIQNLNANSANDVVVNTVGLPANTWDIRFQGTGQDVMALTGTGSGGSSVSVNTIFNGGAGSGGTKRLGQNTYDAYDLGGESLRFDFDNGLAAQNALGGLGLGANEGFGSRGDSGGPGFIFNNVSNTWEIATVVSFTDAQASPPDLNNYLTAGNGLQRDNSFGEVNVDTFVAEFVDDFVDPTLDGAHHLVLDMSRQPHSLDGITDDLAIVLRRSGANLELELTNVSSPNVFEGIHVVPLSDVLSLTVRGAGDNEMLIVDFAGGDPIPAGGLDFDGNNGTDSLVIENGPAATYTPNVNLQPDEGTLTLGGSTITFADLEFVRPVDPVISGISLNDTSINENDSVTLSGSFIDPGSLSSHTLLVDWGEGTPPSLVPLTVGDRSFAVNHTYLDDDPTGTAVDNYAITVTLTDDDGLSDGDGTSITVANVDPVIVDFASDATFADKAEEGEPVNILANFTDVGTLDTHTAVVDWGDGSPLEMVTVNQGAGSGTVTGSHAYATGGIFTITVTLSDDDLGTVQSQTLAVVTGVGINQGVLYIVGTNDEDHVSANLVQTDRIRVHADFVDEPHRTFELSDIDSIIVYLCDGDDHASFAGTFAAPMVVHGGNGDDHLQANGELTLLLGDAGNDMLTGQKGRDVLIGGEGEDRLVGGKDDDVLIGGSTDIDHDDVALLNLLAAWGDPLADYATRTAMVDALFSVSDDAEDDRSTGSSGQDLFYAGVGDAFNDRRADETIL